MELAVPNGQVSRKLSRCLLLHRLYHVPYYHSAGAGSQRSLLGFLYAELEPDELVRTSERRERRTTRQMVILVAQGSHQELEKKFRLHQRTFINRTQHSRDRTYTTTLGKT